MPDSTPPLSKKALASQRMRRKIIEVTIEILGSQGYTALTASRLSQQAGISKGALYHHFANLDDVRLNALSFLLSLFFEADKTEHFSSFDDYLAASGDLIFRRIKQQPLAIKALYAFIFQALVDDSVKRQIQDMVTYTLDEYAEAIKHYCPHLPAQRLDQAVLIIDAYFGGAVLHWFLLNDEAACLASWQLFRNMLTNYLQTGETT